MWLITQNGAYSVVAYDPDRDPVKGERPPAGTHLLVRARASGDLEAIRYWVPDLAVGEDRTADYPYRAVISRADWDRAMAAEAAMVDYPTDLKGRVGEVMGVEREALYTQVWGILRGIRDEQGRQ
jgi:hypothetical protein